ncbi:hypothetical protein JWG41_20090 [Leptospira sp. 201903075]|nr:hypothetical protein [Leptospira chreensis]MBM9592747.1 hypothetical protein [Leptospira chreensis]
MPIILSLWIFLGNCYFNPIVNGFLNPIEDKNNNASLGILGLALGTTNLLITGQLRNSSGEAMVGLVLSLPATSNNTKSTLPPYTTDSGGRFYLPYQLGKLSFTVSQNESKIFTLVLNVSGTDNITSEVTDTVSNYEISNLGTIRANAPPNFFELVKAYYLDQGMNEVSLHNATVTNYIPGFIFRFSEAPMPGLETGPLVEEWIAQNIATSPQISFDNFMNVSENTLTIAAMTLPGSVEYELTLKPGVLSATGKLLTQRTIRFNYQYNP